MEENSRSLSQSTPFISASMVDLKAELSRKKAEFQQERLSHINAVKGRKVEKISLKKKASSWDAQNRGVSERAQKDYEESTEEVDELLKSRSILEEKSKIYNALTSSKSIPEDNGSEGYLVDFQRKVLDSVVEERERTRREEEEAEERAERKALNEPIPEPENSDEEWVDYTDSLGRSKRCLKKDLKDLKKMDRDLKQSLSAKASEGFASLKTNQSGDDSMSLHLMSNDMYREKMRQKWEAETRELVEKGQEEIHYSNVQYDEIRTHGVGFFQFSKDQQERESQMDELNKLRDKTKDEKSRNEKIKDKRKALMEARLAKVKERRKLKTKEIPHDEGETEIGPKLTEADLEEKKKEEELKRLKEEEEKLAEEARKKYVREWDKKKKVVSSWLGDNYVEKRRAEREAEFAPPSIYGTDTNAQSKQSSVPPHNNNRVIFGQNSKHNQSKMKDDSDEKNSVAISTSDAVSSFNVPLNSIPLPNMPEHQHSSVPVQTQQEQTLTNIDQFHNVNSNTDTDKPDVSFPFPMQNSLPLNCQYGAATTPAMSNTQIPWQLQQHQQHNEHQQQYQHQYWNQQQYVSTLTSNPIGDSHNTLAPNYSSCSQSNSSNSYTGHNPIHSQIVTTTFTSPTSEILTNTSTYKRPLTHKSNDNNHEESYFAAQKPKVPKSAIIDNRFILNSDTEPSSSGETESFVAVPYKPGSFTEAKFKHETPDDTVPLSRGKVEICGGPILYARKEQQQQSNQLKGEEKESLDNDAEEKVEEFLKSIRNETM